MTATETAIRLRHDRASVTWGAALKPGKAVTMTVAGLPGHGTDASPRRPPARIVEERAEGGCTSISGIICYHCGDHQYLDCVQIPPRLRRICGPCSTKAAIAAFEHHFLTRN